MKRAAQTHGNRDAWLALRVLGWFAVLGALKYLLPLPVLVRFARSAPVSGAAIGERRLLRILTRIPRGRCLERSLVLYRFLGQDGSAPSLVIGMNRSPRGVAGHAWVTVSGHPRAESAQFLDAFTALMTFGPDGKLTTQPEKPSRAGRA